MYLNIQLNRAQSEIDKGLKQRAANRLKNVLNTYPDATEAREMLALMYYESGFLGMAGLYWMLTDPTEDYIRECIKVYKESVKSSSIQILSDLKYRGDKSGLSGYAYKKLTAIENEVISRERSTSYKSKKTGNHSEKETFKEKLMSSAPFGIVLLCLIFFITGVIVSITWVINLF
ncbi:DUF6584 family protein [uncultured Flavobacterium sp.]|uniref:DUF6584 family protein n=1 Tax=uncultured Flavobacterium sp. TaxID=165435 RepID=UPI0025FD5384|nr:DUF6584 family protein [uncultured Flavobacterium sp.]